MNSSLCHGWLNHRRLTPGLHAFRYRIGMFYLDLDELPQLLNLSRWLGRSRLAPLCWRETDYLPVLTGRGMPLVEAARLLVGQATGQVPEGAVYLLTQPRCWGLSFNPVSMYFYHDRHGQVAAVLLEVRNTPWRERFHYVLPAHGELAQPFAVAKAFHVSPFLPMDMDYRLRFAVDAQRVRVHMENWRAGQQVFTADLALHRQPLDRANLQRHIRAFPWMSLRTVTGIYWQALRLLLKRTPVHDHIASQHDLALGQTLREEPDHVRTDLER